MPYITSNAARMSSPLPLIHSGVAAGSPSLMKICADAQRALPDATAAARLVQLEWFTAACAAEQSGDVAARITN